MAMRTLLKVLSIFFHSRPDLKKKKKTLKHPNASNSFPNIVICLTHTIERQAKAREIYTWCYTDNQKQIFTFV